MKPVTCIFVSHKVAWKWKFLGHRGRSLYFHALGTCRQLKKNGRIMLVTFVGLVDQVTNCDDNIAEATIY